jgi:hypothetical protein
MTNDNKLKPDWAGDDLLSRFVNLLIQTGPMKLYKIGQPWQNEHFYCQ